MLQYVKPARMASITSPNAPAGTACPAGPTTLAEVSVPETLPEFVALIGHIGVMDATAAGAGLVAVWHSQMDTPPATFAWPMWICPSVGLPSRSCQPISKSI